MTVITANRKSLVSTLAAGASILEATSIDVFNNVKIAVAKGRATFTFASSDIWLTTEIEASADAITATTLPCAVFSKAVSAMEEDSVTIDTAGPKAVLRCGRSRLSLATIAADQFPAPEWPSLTEDAAIVDAGLFAEALSNSSYAAPDLMVSGFLPAVRIECRDGEVWICTFDSTRLAADSVTNLGGEAYSFNLPLKAVKLVARLAGEGGEVRFCSTDRFAVFEVGRWRAMSRLVEGDFRSFDKPIAERTDFPVMFDPGELRRALTRLSTVADNYSKGVKFELKHDHLELSLVNQKVGEASEEVPIGYEGEPQTVGFSLPYLRDALRQMPGDDAEMHIFDPIKRALICNRDGAGGTHIIGPFAV